MSIAELGLKKYPNFIQLKVLYAEALIKWNALEKGIDILLDVIMEDRCNFYALKLLAILYKSYNYNDIAYDYIKEAHILAPEDQTLSILLKEFSGNISTICDKKPTYDDIKFEENYTLINEFILEAEKTISHFSNELQPDKKFSDDNTSNNTLNDVLTSCNNNSLPDDLLKTIYSEAGIDNTDDIYSENERIDYQNKKGD